MKPTTFFVYLATGIVLLVWSIFASFSKNDQKPTDPAAVKKILSEPDKARKWTDGKTGKTDELKIEKDAPRQTAGSLGEVLTKAPADLGSASILQGDVKNAKLLAGRFEVAAVVPISTPFPGAAILLEPLDKQADTDAKSFAVWAYCADANQLVIDARQAWLNNPSARSQVTIAKASPLVLMASNVEGKKVYLHALPSSPKNGIAGIVGGAGSVNQASTFGGGNDLATAAKEQAEADKQAQADELNRQADEKKAAAIAAADAGEWAKAKAMAKEADKLTVKADELTGGGFFNRNQAEQAVMAKSDEHNQALVNAYNERLEIAETAKRVAATELERKINAREVTGTAVDKAVEEIQNRYKAAVGKKPDQIIWNAL